MGLLSETFVKQFPRTTSAVQKYYALVDTLPLQYGERQALKAHMTLVVGSAIEEASRVSKAVEFVRGMFNK